MARAKSSKPNQKGASQGPPTLTHEEANEQNKQQLAKQNQGGELKDFYCKECRKLTPKTEMKQDKDGYYLCLEH